MYDKDKHFLKIKNLAGCIIFKTMYEPGAYKFDLEETSIFQIR